MINNNPLILEANNVLRDDKYVSLINEVSNSIYQYALAAKGNFKEMQNIFHNMDNELRNNNFINSLITLINYNENNLNNFFNDAKSSFKDLRLVRKEFLLNISNFINLILTENTQRTNFRKKYKSHDSNHINNYNLGGKIGKFQNFSKLLLKLKKYIDIIGII